MTLNESIVEYAALEWFWELGDTIGHGPHIAPGEPAAERGSFGEVVLVGRLSKVSRWNDSTMAGSGQRGVEAVYAGDGLPKEVVWFEV